MSREKKILIMLVSCVIFVIVILIVCKNKKKISQVQIQNDNILINENIQVKTNEEGLYEIYNEKNNQVITTVESESELKKYQENPRYDEFAPKISK